MWIFKEKLTWNQMAEGDHGGAGGSDGNGGAGGDAGAGGDGAGDDGGAGGEGGGQSGPEWLGGLPEELRGNETLAGIESVDALAQNFLELQGKQVVVPESADGYELTLPDGQKMNDSELSGIKKAFHDAGVPAESAKALFNSILADRQNMAEQKAEAIKAMKETALTNLKKGWGADTKANIEKANNAVGKVFGAEFAKFMVDTGLGNNEHFIKGMHAIATKIGEDNFEINGGSGDGFKKDDAGRAVLKFKGMD